MSLAGADSICLIYSNYSFPDTLSVIMDNQTPPEGKTPEQMDSGSFRQALLGLTSEDINQRIEAVRILGCSRRIEAIKPLRQAFRDGGNILRSYARQALERLQEDLQLERLTLVDDMTESASSGEKTEDDTPRRLNMDKLREHLENNDPKIRIGVAQAAAQFKEKELLPDLVNRLDREYHLFVIASLLLAIGKLGGDDELDVLYPYLKHDDERIRANALEAIQHTGSRKVDLTLILHLVNDPAERVANNAARLISMFDSSQVGKSLDSVENNPEMQQTATAVKKMRGDPPLQPTILATPAITPTKVPWIPVTLTLIVLIATAGFFLFRPAPPAVEEPATPVVTNTPDPELIRVERLEELETLLQEDKLNRAEILLRTAIKENKDDPMTRLLAAEFLIRRKLWLKASEALSDLQPPRGRENHFNLLLTEIDLGLDNKINALRRLEELTAQRSEDRWVTKGKLIFQKLQQQFKQEDARVLEGVRNWLNQWFTLLSSDFSPVELEKLVEDNTLRKSIIEQIQLEQANSSQWKTLQISSEVRLERKREGPRIIAECLEFQQGRMTGGLPVFIPQHRIYTFSYDPKPTLINLENATDPGIMIDHPLTGLAGVWQMRLRNLKDSVDKLVELQARFPDNGYIHLTLAETLQSLQKSQEIIEQLNGKINSFHFQPAHLLGDDILRGELYDLLANARRDTGDTEGFARDLAEAARLAPEHCRILVEQMALAQETNDTGTWTKAYQQALQSEPDYPFLDRIFYPEMFSQILQVRDLITQQNFRDSMEILTTMRQKNQKYWRIYAESGEIFFRLERTDQAITQFEEALKLNPGHAGLMRRLAQCFFLNEETEDARAWARKALDRDSSQKSKLQMEKILQTGKSE